jgi:hypothetical protein
MSGGSEDGSLITIEKVEIMLSGSQDGWTAVNGELVTGEGTYEI